MGVPALLVALLKLLLVVCSHNLSDGHTCSAGVQFIGNLKLSDG
jgi:hypothetical protein